MPQAFVQCFCDVIGMSAITLLQDACTILWLVFFCFLFLLFIEYISGIYTSRLYNIIADINAII